MGRALAWLAVVLFAAAVRAQTACTVYYNGQANGTYGIGRAVTTNPACNGGWVRSPASPLLGANTHAPMTVRVGNTFYTYYDIAGVFNGIYLATSVNGVSLNNQGLVVNQGSFPFVVYDPADGDAGRRWKMFFSTATFNGVAYAFSGDGIHWTQYNGGAPVLSIGGVGSSDAYRIIMGSARRADDGRWWLWYSGARNGIGPTYYEAYLPHLATASVPTGPWTKSTANPLLQNRASTNVTLTGTWSSGTVFFVGVTPTFAANEMIFVNGNQITQVLSTNASGCPATNCGQVFVRDAPTQSYPAGTVVRSLYSASVDVTAPIADPVTGQQRFMLVGYEMFTDQGLLRERGGYAIVNTPTPGPTPTGTVPPLWQSTSWSYDFASGMILEGGTWDAQSAENMQPLVDMNTPAVPATATLTPTATPSPTATFRGTQTPFSCPGGPG